MKYFLPDSQDLVDPSFDFEKETRSPTRIRQRDDHYFHEVFDQRGHDGVLVSKAIVDGSGGAGGRYTIGQRTRLLRLGAREFFRMEEGHLARLPIMGDCGGFSYVKEKVPPYTVDEVLGFYDRCDFDLGVSVDHVILGYDARLDARGAKPPDEFKERQEITLELASEFLTTHRDAGLRFFPMGVAQGWSPKSYAMSVRALQRMGYRYIAVGGMVPLKSPEILEVLEGINQVRKKSTKLHLLGITRLEHIARFADMGAVSLDSTSPLRQAFKDDKDNYYTLDGAFSAIRIPQVEGNYRLQKLIRAGQVDHDSARRLEKESLQAMERFATGKRKKARPVAKLLARYEQFLGARKDHTDTYTQVLEASPWEQCGCSVCRDLGYHVILFRGAERNRRRGFHNVWVFYQRLQRELGLDYETRVPQKQPPAQLRLVQG